MIGSEYEVASEKPCSRKQSARIAEGATRGQEARSAPSPADKSLQVLERLRHVRAPKTDAKVIPIVLELGSREEKHALGFNELGAKTIYFARAQAWEGDAAGAGSCPNEALAEIIEESVEKWKVVRDDLSTPRDHPLSGAKGNDGENHCEDHPARRPVR